MRALVASVLLAAVAAGCPWLTSAPRRRCPAPHRSRRRSPAAWPRRGAADRAAPQDRAADV